MFLSTRSPPYFPNCPVNQALFTSFAGGWVWYGQFNHFVERHRHS